MSMTTNSMFPPLALTAPADMREMLDQARAVFEAADKAEALATEARRDAAAVLSRLHEIDMQMGLMDPEQAVIWSGAQFRSVTKQATNVADRASRATQRLSGMAASLHSQAERTRG